MIEKLVPLKIPPGVVKNGTLYERAGRWIDGNLVRFLESGHPQAIGDFGVLSTTASPPGGTPRGAFIWRANNKVYAVCGTNTKLYVVSHDGATFPHVLTNITPAGYVDIGTQFVWQFDTINDHLIALSYSQTEAGGGGVPYEWDLVAATATSLSPSGAPTSLGVVVTPENFLVLLVSDRTVKWASQGTTTTWVPASTNSAGSLTLATSGRVVSGRIVRGQTLIWTTADLWGLNYVGASLYYGASQLGDNCGIIAPNAVAVANGVAYWMGTRGFYSFDGYVKPLPCDLAEEIYGDLRSGFNNRIFAIVNSPWNEIWWFYPSTASSTELDRVAIYNYANGTWSGGALARQAGTDALWPGQLVNGGAMPVPLLYFSTSAIDTHETGGAIAGAFLESGPLLLTEEGNRRFTVNKLVPDNNQSTSPETVTVFVGGWPKETETSTAFSIPSGGGPIDLRLSGRYIRLKQQLTVAASRIGTWRAGVVFEGTR